MTDWDAYARVQPHTKDAYANEPVQVERIQNMARRVVGTVLDVGCSDGYSTSLLPGDPVVCDMSLVRVLRATKVYGAHAGVVGDGGSLPFRSDSFDTVVLGEVVEHTPNPGALLSEAFRCARQRVVASVPLNGWADPTHLWRISLDHFYDMNQHAEDWTKGEQITLTFQRGSCWPPTYYHRDLKWRAQFKEGR